jgi:hypothetical protein
MKKLYHATDSDLPASLWPGGKIPTSNVKNDPVLEAMVRVQRHYQALEETRNKSRAEKILYREARDQKKSHSKQFIRRAKAAQMAEWILSLECQEANKRMDSYELDFFEKMRAKFIKYYGKGEKYRIKWLTLKQYEFLWFIASKYLQTK